MTNASKLESHGFELLTTWELRNGKAKLKSTAWDDTSGWIYSFVVAKEVKYIGIASTVLRSRFDGYSYQLNDSVGHKIFKLLEDEVEVQAWGVRRGPVGREVLEAEESKLIEEFDPPWNVRK